MALSSLAFAAILLAFNPVVLANVYDVYAAAILAISSLWVAAVIYEAALMFLLAMVPGVIMAMAETRVDMNMPLRSLSAAAICIVDLLDFWIYGLSRKGWVPLLSVVWTGRALISGEGMYTDPPII